MSEQYGAVESVNTIDDLIGKTFAEVATAKDNEELHFILANGDKYIFYHGQDCCECVLIEDVCGELSDLVGSPITMAEETIHENICNKDYESATYTFYKFATAKGYVTVRWCGTSNGFYSERVDFMFRKRG